jgi:SNF2 family DNA or RNA helicase
MRRGRAEIVPSEVRASELLDRLVVTPREPGERHALRRALKDALPGVRVHRAAEGLWIRGHDSDALLGVDVGPDLRWSEEARRFAENRRWVKAVHGRLRQQVQAVLSGGRSLAEAHLAGAHGLDVLDDHQWVNVAAMTLPEGFGLCVFDEQGVGKTVTFIFAFDVLAARDEVDFALIVAPKSVVSEWPRDFARFKGDLYRVVVAAGTRQDKRLALRSGADVIVTNFETALVMEDELRPLLRSHGNRAILTVDESFYVKNLDAQRTRALRRLREWCGRAFVLCGTPAPNAPDDLIQQFNVVDFGLTFADAHIPEDRDAARPVVQRLIEERGLFVRHLKRDVLPELPRKAFNHLLLRLQPQQERLYAGALKDLIVDLKATDDRAFLRQLPSFLARRSALLQICSNPTAVAPDYSEVPAKLLALDDLLGELITARREKVIVWSFYTASLAGIGARYGMFNPVCYDGSVDVAGRREAVRRFQEDDDTMLFVGNPAAAGAGLNLHRARFAIYESMSNQAAHYLQSLDRIHRRGQERPVEYLILLCDGTLEVLEYERLKRKEAAAYDLLGDEREEPVTREAMLTEALTLSGLLQERP